MGFIYAISLTLELGRNTVYHETSQPYTVQNPSTIVLVLLKYTVQTHANEPTVYNAYLLLAEQRGCSLATYIII